MHKNHARPVYPAGHAGFKICRSRAFSAEAWPRPRSGLGDYFGVECDNSTNYPGHGPDLKASTTGWNRWCGPTGPGPSGRIAGPSCPAGSRAGRSVVRIAHPGFQNGCLGFVRPGSVPCRLASGRPDSAHLDLGHSGSVHPGFGRPGPCRPALGRPGSGRPDPVACLGCLVPIDHPVGPVGLADSCFHSPSKFPRIG